MHLLVDHHGGSKAAGAQAGDGFHRKHHIVGSVLFLAQAQFFPQGLQHRGGMADMAGSTVTNLDDILALGLKGEVFVECCHAVCFGFRNADLFGNVAEQFAGQVAIFCLDILHDGN